MTIADHRPAPSNEARALLAEAAKDYAKAEKRRKGLDRRDDAGVHARAARATGDQYDNARVTN